MKVLELFSGTGSVEKVCKKLEWESVSVDKFLPADHFVDIFDFNYKQYPKNHFEKMEQDMEDADKLVLKTLETINYFNVKWWFIENPQTGKLKTREVVEGLNYYDVDYCMYSDWGYRKRTRIWTNRTDFKPKKCYHTKHQKQVVPSRKGTKGTTNKLDRYRVPENLILDLFGEKIISLS